MLDRFIDPDDDYYEQIKPDCSECYELKKQISISADLLEQVLDQLYGRRTYDELKLEGCLDELCDFLNVRTYSGDLQIQSKYPQKSIHKEI